MRNPMAFFIGRRHRAQIFLVIINVEMMMMVMMLFLFFRFPLWIVCLKISALLAARFCGPFLSRCQKFIPICNASEVVKFNST